MCACRGSPGTLDHSFKEYLLEFTIQKRRHLGRKGMYKLFISKDRIVKESGMDMYILLFFKMDNQQEPII